MELFDSSKNGLTIIAYQILEVITDLSLEDNPIIFHIFSNGGCLVYQKISHILFVEPIKDYKAIHIIGCVFDSCPSQRNIFIATKAFMKSINKHWLVAYIIGFFFLLYMIALKIKLSIIGSFEVITPESKTKVEYWDYLLNEPSDCPQMYLYSKKDEIVSADGIDAIVAHRKKMGVDVSAHCWEDTAHVQHLRKHREAYMNLCYDFLQHCLDKNNEVQKGTTD